MITGTLINYYVHCKRQCYLCGNRINLEDNSELVKIGKVISEENDELAIDNIKVDKISEEYVTEVKKSDADLEAAKWQLMYYLYVLKKKGINRKGRVEVIEKNKQSKKYHYFELDDDNLKILLSMIEEIKALLITDKPPKYKYEKKCNKCAYFDYCEL